MTILNVILMYFVFSANSNYKKFKESNINQKVAFNFELKEWFGKSIYYSKNQLYISEKYVHDLINLVGESQKVVIRIPISACKPCIDESLNAMRKYDQNFIKNKFLIITSFRTIADYEYFIQENGLDDYVSMNIPIEDLNLNEKELIGLYFFKIGTDLTISDILFYSSSTSFLLSDYLNFVL